MSQPVPYFQYTTRSRLNKSINTLLGIMEGVALDGVINATELEYLDAWIAEHRDVESLHPFSELLPVIRESIADGKLDDEERKDLKWLCDKVRSTDYYDTMTADMQRLHAVLGGVVSDGEIAAEELRGLRVWLEEHEHLKTLWPYDEISSLITGVLADGRIDNAEHDLLRAFFGEFVMSDATNVVASTADASTLGVAGICASCPEIEFAGMKFCFTGGSARYTRDELFDTVRRLGGTVTNSVSGKLNVLVVGADGNPCWAYACYGRKIAQAMQLRKSGARILVVHENDFHDAVADTK
jgi:NAD-dependent DNA ligase